MDIASHYPRPQIPHRTSSEEKISLTTSNTVYTYHCLCTHLLLATTTPLPSLPTRQHAPDAAHIMPLPPPPSAIPTSKRSVPTQDNHYGLLISTTLDRTPVILRSDEGFEKRYLQRCGRCALVIGYQLDWASFDVPALAAVGAEAKQGRREDVVFLLPGGFVTTREMVMGKEKGKGLGDLEVGGVKSIKV